jgi:hypothetical protein
VQRLSELVAERDWYHEPCAVATVAPDEQTDDAAPIGRIWVDRGETGASSAAGSKQWLRSKSRTPPRRAEVELSGVLPEHAG